MVRRILAGMLLMGMTGVAAGQGMQAATVSVATLQVPAKAREHFERARKALIAGKTDEYEREIANALEVDRNFAEAYVLRGSQEVVRRDFQAALTDSYMAERLDRGAVCAKTVQASALNGMRRFSDAWAVLQTMGRAEGETWEAKYERARAAVGMGSAEAALHWSAEAFEVVPVESLDSARVLRGDALQMAGRYREAAGVWREYLASPRAQPYREQVLAALAQVERRVAAEEVAVLKQ